MLYDEDGHFAGGMCDGGQGPVHLAEIMVKRTVSVPFISAALLLFCCMVVLLLCCSGCSGPFLCYFVALRCFALLCVAVLR